MVRNTNQSGAPILNVSLQITHPAGHITDVYVPTLLKQWGGSFYVPQEPDK